MTSGPTAPLAILLLYCCCGISDDDPRATLIATSRSLLGVLADLQRFLDCVFNGLAGRRSCSGH